MNDPTAAFWTDLAEDLEDSQFLRDYIVQSVRIQAINDVVNQLEVARTQLGLSKAALARAINSDPASIRRLLSNAHANPTLGTLAELAAVLGYSITLTPLSAIQEAEISEPLRTGRADDTLTVAQRFHLEAKSA